MILDLFYRIAPGLLAILPAGISYYFYKRKHEENDKQFKLLMSIETTSALIIIYTILWMTNKILTVLTDNIVPSSTISVPNTQWYVISIFITLFLIHVVFVLFVFRIVAFGSQPNHEQALFENQSEAVASIKESTFSSRQIRILAIRGVSYVNDDGDFNFIWDNKEKRIELILSALNNRAISQRSRLYIENNEEYKREIKLIQETLKEKHKEYQNLTCYTHNIDLPFRLIILDKQIYLSFFNDGIKASASQIYKYDRDSQMYQALNKYYKTVRRRSKKNNFIERNI